MMEVTVASARELLPMLGWVPETKQLYWNIIIKIIIHHRKTIFLLTDIAEKTEENVESDLPNKPYSITLQRRN